MMAALNGAGSGHPRNGIFAAAAVFLSCVWVTLSLRLWVRVSIIKGLGWDDATLLFAALIFTGYCVDVILIETVGGAPRVEHLSASQLSQLINFTVASFILYLTTMIFVKISLGIFFLRFVIRPWGRYIVHVTIIISTGYGIFLCFVALFNCGNPSQYLENTLRGTCVPNKALYGIQLAGAVVNALTDWVLAILPIFILRKANMPARAKISAGLVLLLGCCGSVVSLVRIQYVKGILPGPNFFNSAINLCIWSIIECGLGISAAAAATLRPLFRSLRERTRILVSSGGRTKSPMESANQTRVTNTMFGDWDCEAPQQEHELRETPSRSHSSTAPTFQVSHMTSKGHSASNSTPKLTPRPSALSRQTSNLTEDRMKGMNKSSESQIRPEMERQTSVREKGISRPIPHIIRQYKIPPPNAGEHEQDRIRVDHRRVGSPDWVPRVNGTPDLSPNQSIDSRNPYSMASTLPLQGRPF